MDINMANEFPCFSFASEADKFLSMFKNNKDVVFQLRNRHIYKVKLMELISNGGLGIEEDGNFFVFLNDLLTEEEMANTLGHELGHTFHVDLSVIPPTVICELSEQNEKEIEKFFDKFSKLWLKQLGQVNKENIIYRIKNERQLLF